MLAWNHTIYFFALAGHAASNWFTGRALRLPFQLMPN